VRHGDRTAPDAQQAAGSSSERWRPESRTGSTTPDVEQGAGQEAQQAQAQEREARDGGEGPQAAADKLLHMIGGGPGHAPEDSQTTANGTAEQPPQQRAPRQPAPQQQPEQRQDQQQQLEPGPLLHHDVEAAGKEQQSAASEQQQQHLSAPSGSDEAADYALPWVEVLQPQHVPPSQQLQQQQPQQPQLEQRPLQHRPPPQHFLPQHAQRALPTTPAPSHDAGAQLPECCACCSVTEGQKNVQMCIHFLAVPAHLFQKPPGCPQHWVSWRSPSPGRCSELACFA
jgi:hypothetical protein